jgi:hypothetical protein
MIFVFLSYYAVKRMIVSREQDRFTLDASEPIPPSLAPSRRTTWSRSSGPLSRTARLLSRLLPFMSRYKAGRSTIDLELGLRTAARRASNSTSNRTARPAQTVAKLVALTTPGEAFMRAVMGEARARSDSEGTAGSGWSGGRGRDKGERSASPASRAMMCEEEDPCWEEVVVAVVGRVEDEARRERKGAEESPGLARASAVGGMLEVPVVSKLLLTSANT